jgi:hypothetical protein
MLKTWVSRIIVGSLTVSGAVASGPQEARAAAPAATPAAVKKPAPTLDGTSWNVKLTPDAATAKKGEKAFDDTLGFFEGKIDLMNFSQLGFYPPYKAKASGAAVAFNGNSRNTKGDKLTLQGQVKGQTVSGSVVHTLKDGTVHRFSLSGTRMGAPTAP